MRSPEKTALAKRAAKYLTVEWGYANAAMHFHFVAFAAREVDRERKERRTDKAEYRYFAKQVLDRWGVQHADKIIDEIFGATSARGKGTERTCATRTESHTSCERRCRGARRG